MGINKKMVMPPSHSTPPTHNIQTPVFKGVNIILIDNTSGIFSCLHLFFLTGSSQWLYLYPDNFVPPMPDNLVEFFRFVINHFFPSLQAILADVCKGLLGLQVWLIIPSWYQCSLTNIEPLPLDLFNLPPESREEMFAAEEVLDRDVNTKEEVTDKYPGNVVDDELCSLINAALLEKDDEDIVKISKQQDDSHVDTSVFECEDVSVMSSPKL